MAVADLMDQVATTRLDELVSWCRKNSLWPMPFATACCGSINMAMPATATIAPPTARRLTFSR